MSPLTRKTQVLDALANGGAILRDAQRPTLLVLRDACGAEIPAWQQALSGALAAYHIDPAALPVTTRRAP